MFDLISLGAFSYYQAMLILAALFCCGAGALLIAHELHWRLHALRVAGTVIGVRETKPGMFSSVYSYVLPPGTLTEGTSDISSNTPRGRETGRDVQLMVFADRPDKVVEAGSFTFLVVGMLLLLAGAWPMYEALSASPVSIATLLMLAGGIGAIVYKVRSNLIPEQRPTPSEWRRERIEKHRAQLAAIPVRRIEDVLEERKKA